MNRFIIGAYTLSGLYVISTVAYLLSQDYSLAITIGLMSFIYFHMGQKMRKNKATGFKSLTTMFLALAALFFITAADYGLDGKYINAVLNLAAAGASYWVATIVSKK